MSKNQTGKLIHGFEYKGKNQVDFEMAPVASTGDLFDAEMESGGVHNELAFNGSLMARQLVRIGDCTGPFTIEQIRKFKPNDFQRLRIAQAKLNAVTESPKGDGSESESGNTSC